eukprot:54365-Lingulodinium_polyedra.AAC.1
MRCPVLHGSRRCRRHDVQQQQAVARLGVLPGLSRSGRGVDSFLQRPKAIWTNLKVRCCNKYRDRRTE